MAMAPPVRREWLLTASGGKPFLSSPKRETADLINVLMSPACSGGGGVR
jgi:hypothetical protein